MASSIKGKLILILMKDDDNINEIELLKITETANIARCISKMGNYII